MSRNIPAWILKRATAGAHGFDKIPLSLYENTDFPDKEEDFEEWATKVRKTFTEITGVEIPPDPKDLKKTQESGKVSAMMQQYINDHKQSQ